MNKLAIFKETALPTQLAANGIYLVAPQSNTDYLEIYVTDKTGAAVRRTVNIDDVTALIDEALAHLIEAPSEPTAPEAVKSLTVVQNIAERDALALTESAFIYVVDASGDSTVNSGSASYVYDVVTSQYYKVSEYESMDFILSWENLTNKPSSTVAQIDGAVQNSHSHANSAVLDKLSTDADGNLTFNGALPVTGWASTNW